ERRRRRAVERYAALVRTDEREMRRVETNTAQRIAARAVRFVAHDRMPQVGELRTDLAAPARRQRELDERGIAALLEHAIVGDRFLAAVAPGRRAHAETAVDGEPALQRS